MIAWLKDNPAAFASLASAIIAASVALLVFAVTQFVAGRRDRTAFLTSKLEELYLLLNEVGEKNATHFDLMMLCLAGDRFSIEKLREMGSVELYGGNRAKRMIMLIRLYFPELTRTHKQLFAAENALSVLKHLVREGEKVERKKMLSASHTVGRLLVLLEKELIVNQSALLHSNYFPRKYSETPQAEIEEAIKKADESPPNDENRSADKS